MFEQDILTPDRMGSNRVAARALGDRLAPSLLFLLFAVACSGSDAVAPDGRHDAIASSMVTAATGGDIRGIQQLVEEFEAAFAAKDAVAYGNAYADDADFVNPVGVVTIGRAAITAQHAFLFAGPFAPATLTAELHDVTFLTGTIALADVHTTLTDAGTPPPFAVVSPDGAVRSHTRWLVEKRGGEWEIVLSYHRGWGD